MAVLGADYPRFRLVLIAVSIVVLAGLVLWFGCSRTGTRIQAMVGNPELARALGVPVRQLCRGALRCRHVSWPGSAA